MFGRDSANSEKLALPFVIGLAKYFGVTLLFRPFMEIVFTPERSACLYFAIHSVLHLMRKERLDDFSIQF
jgi:hypothetical protein